MDLNDVELLASQIREILVIYYNSIYFFKSHLFKPLFVSLGNRNALKIPWNTDNFICF